MSNSSKMAALAVAIFLGGEMQTVWAQVQFPVPLPTTPQPRGYRGFMPSHVPTPPNDNTGSGLAGVPPLTLQQNSNLGGQLGGQLGQLGGQAGQLGGQLGQLGGQLGQLGGQAGQLGGQLGQLGGHLAQLGGRLGQLGGQLRQLGGGGQ